MGWSAVDHRRDAPAPAPATMTANPEQSRCGGEYIRHNVRWQHIRHGSTYCCSAWDTGDSVQQIFTAACCCTDLVTALPPAGGGWHWSRYQILRPSHTSPATAHSVSSECFAQYLHKSLVAILRVCEWCECRSLTKYPQSPQISPPARGHAATSSSLDTAYLLLN